MSDWTLVSVTTFINNLGFPIFIAIWLIFTNKRQLDDLKAEIQKLTFAMQGRETKHDE
jgi:hypothetical protein